MLSEAVNRPVQLQNGGLYLRGLIELDYKQLKGELGLDHYEGRSYLGWHHHTAPPSAAHGLLTLERLRPKARRPA